MVTGTWHARGFAGQFDTWRHECRECDSEFGDDCSHLRAADGLAAVCAAKPITFCECDVSYLAPGSHRDLEPGLSSGPAPVTKCEHSAGSCLAIRVPRWWDECRLTANAGHIGGDPYNYDHRGFVESHSRYYVETWGEIIM
jgi:hypothetical protein